MKRQLLVIAASFVLLVLTFSSASAQNANVDRLTATIPFEFSVPGKTLPAGEYIVAVVNPASPVTVLQISRKSGRGSVALQTNALIGKKHEEASLVFRRYGDQYFLAQAWMPWDTNGLAILKSRAERELQRNRSLANVRPSTVAIGLKR